MEVLVGAGIAITDGFAMLDEIKEKTRQMGLNIQDLLPNRKASKE